MNDHDTHDPKADATRGKDLRTSAEEAPAGADAAAEDPRGAKASEPRRGVEPHAQPALSEDEDSDVQTELEILRGELAAMERRVQDAERGVDEAQSRALRARAELDTVRRRAAGEEARARDAGRDEALLPVMSVFDDLRRALHAAESGDPEKIVPGVRAVMENLERSLERLGIRRVGEVGDAFDPDLHEAVTSVASPGDAQAGTVAEVFESGFAQEERLVRPAKVVVYQDPEG